MYALLYTVVERCVYLFIWRTRPCGQGLNPNPCFRPKPRLETLILILILTLPATLVDNGRAARGRVQSGVRCKLCLHCVRSQAAFSNLFIPCLLLPSR